MKQLMKKMKLGIFGKAERGATKDQLNAIAELEHYSNRELADLGLSRSNIRNAVLHGK